MRRFRNRMDRTTTCATVSSNFVVTRRIGTSTFLNWICVLFRPFATRPGNFGPHSQPLFLPSPELIQAAKFTALCSSRDSLGFSISYLPLPNWGSVSRTCGIFHIFSIIWSLRCKHQKNHIPVSSIRMSHWFPASCQNSPGFQPSPHNGAYKRLADADDLALNVVGIVVIYVLLLLINIIDRLQTLHLVNICVFPRFNLPSM